MSERENTQAGARDGAPTVLRLLSGGKPGAEMELLPARYRIGAASGADILVEGDGVADEHLVAVFADGVLTLLSVPAKGAAVYVAGERVASFPRDVEALQPVTLAGGGRSQGGGRAAFAFGPAGGPWPEPPEIEVRETAGAPQGRGRGALLAAIAVAVVLLLAGGGAAWLALSGTGGGRPRGGEPSGAHRRPGGAAGGAPDGP